MGTGKGVQPEATFYEQTMVAGSGSNNNTMATTTSTTPTPSPRWNPTPEQLLALEEMYRRGIRTPSANQIQQMALELLKFGKIEGKNVFYWFQNHKARERQKRRREGENSSKLHKQDACKSESGIRISADNVQLQHSKISVASSQCQRNTEGFTLIQRQSSAKGKRIITHEENQLSHFVNNDTWQNGFFPSPIFHNSFPNTPKCVALDQEQCDYSSNCTILKNEAREIQTLQLFPLGNINVDCEGMFKTHKRDKEVAVTTINTKSGPGQFFEFLPMKN